MDYVKIGDKVENQYNQSKSDGYRESDNLSILNETHKKKCKKLKAICNSYGHKIKVLDLGCGTGRFFYCLENTKFLLGVDISSHMLENAKDPVRNEDITVEKIELKCANILNIDVKNKFDLIYSLGVLGEHSPFDLSICNNVYKLLNDKGIFYFTVVDADSKKIRISTSRKLAEIILPFIPGRARKKIQSRWKKFYLNRHDLYRIMETSNFSSFDISHLQSTAKWRGAHFECIARK